jgi:hypothetical protein
MATEVRMAWVEIASFLVEMTPFFYEIGGVFGNGWGFLEREVSFSRLRPERRIFGFRLRVGGSISIAA